MCDAIFKQQLFNHFCSPGPRLKTMPPEHFVYKQVEIIWSHPLWLQRRWNRMKYRQHVSQRIQILSRSESVLITTSKWRNITKWSAMKHIIISNRKGNSLLKTVHSFLACFFFFAAELTPGAHVPTLRERHRIFWRTYVIVCKHFKCGYFWNCLSDLLFVCNSWQLYCKPLTRKAELNTDGLARKTVRQRLTNKPPRSSLQREPIPPYLAFTSTPASCL